MRKLGIIQPGRLGDIIICLPIAKYYFDRGYEVIWPVLNDYISLFSNIDYVTALPINSDILNCTREAYLMTDHLHEKIELSFGFPHSKINNVFHENYTFANNFVEAKYKISKVPIKNRWNLVYKRNIKKEDQLFNKLYKGFNYILIHGESSQGEHIKHTPEHSIKVSPIENFNLFDWRKLAMKADELHCVDSSFCNFIESDQSFKSKTKVYIASKSIPSKWGWTTLKNNWTINDPKK